MESLHHGLDTKETLLRKPHLRSAMTNEGAVFLWVSNGFVGQYLYYIPSIPKTEQKSEISAQKYPNTTNRTERVRFVVAGNRVKRRFL